MSDFWGNVTLSSFITAFSLVVTSWIFGIAVEVLGEPLLWFLMIPWGIYVYSYFFNSKIEEAFNKKIAVAEKEKLEVINTATTKITIATADKDVYKKSLLEKSQGFPTLLTVLDEYEKRNDRKIEDYLRYKSHPSRKGAEVVRQEAERRRLAEFKEKQTNLIIELYEKLFPELVAYKNEFIGELDTDFSEEQKEDPVSNFMTRQEYEKLSSVERNQMALDRFWSRRNKSKRLIGLLYERYVGYVFETKGYDVEYFGAKEKLEDLGRDLICTKGNDIFIVQCKRWAKFKTIHEKHIFQLFGTTFLLREELLEKFKDKNIVGLFYTSTKVSELAKKFGDKLGIKILENFAFDQQYPCIKCNISKIDGTKIYHLPFDQQYDTIKIEPSKGEFYSQTIQEAENAGFRRAFRYKGLTKSYGK